MKNDCFAQRVLFYSTAIGKTAMVRQILPDVHIDGE
jgi:hypothetical protein